MYQSYSVYVGNAGKAEPFTPTVTSAYKILADKKYLHICTDDEKALRAPETTAFIRCTAGKGKIYLHNHTIILNENEYVFVKFYDIFKYNSLSNIWGYRWVNFLSENGSEFELNKIYSSKNSETEEACFDRFLSISNITENTNYINALFLNYFYTVCEANKIDIQKIKSDQGNRLIDDICAFILQKVYDKVTVNDVSLFFRITPRRLHQIFSKELKISPKQYIIKKKMEEGYRLLVQTSTPINRISELLCFSSSYHFSNEFKKTFKQTPTEVRNMENN